MSDKKRARHIASDEAHAWARSLELHNPNGKSVLRALTLYVNSESSCFVSIESLAKDTDLSMDTVRRRLVWLESIGAIVRLPQWLDPNGRRNSEGKGRRTTDEIRLLLDADIDEIEARALGDSEDISPSREQPQDFTDDEVSPPVALGQPSQSCEVLISEPEPEDSPQSPPQGGGVEGWKEFEADWFEPILRQTLAQQVWISLKPDERDLARRAARGYVAWRRSQKRPPNVLAAHRFLKERDAWEGFAKYASDPRISGPGSFARDSREAKALINLHDACGAGSGFRQIFCRADAVDYRKPMTPQITAFADMPQAGEWAELDHRQARAWEEFFEQASAMPMRRHFRQSERAPWPWPPSAEGKIYTATGPPERLLTEQDERDMAEFR